MPLSGITQYVYDQAGHLLAESDDSGNTLTEYVWLDDMPIALVANVNTAPAYTTSMSIISIGRSA
jgi:hypothetical protein